MPQTDHTAAETDPAQAFEALRGEVILMKRLVEHLGAVPDRIPNYGPTLGEMTGVLRSIRDGLVRIERSPAVNLTHEAVHEKIVGLSQVVRSEDRQMIVQAHGALVDATARIDHIVKRGQSADRDWRKERWRAAGFVAFGMLIWSIIPGSIARTLPESWHVPEWMAASTMGVGEREAGEKLITLARQRELLPTTAPEPAPMADKQN